MAKLIRAKVNTETEGNKSRKVRAQQCFPPHPPTPSPLSPPNQEVAASGTACTATADERQTKESIQLAPCLRCESQRVAASGRGNSNKSQTNGKQSQARTHGGADRPPSDPATLAKE